MVSGTAKSMLWPQRAAWHLLALLLALPTLLGLLQGCSSTSGSSRADALPVTQSDETDVRRRARLRMELASGYFEHGETKVALDEIKQVIKLDPTFPDAYNMRGLILMRMGDNGLAEESFRKALDLKPNDPDTLHNYGWFKCTQKLYPEADSYFAKALEMPGYLGQSKSWMARGLCQMRAGHNAEAEKYLSRAFEIDAGNPIIEYNLAVLLYGRGDYIRAQFYIRRLNNSELANAQSLWLGIKVENKLGNKLSMQQLSDQLAKRFASSPEYGLMQRGAFDE